MSIKVSNLTKSFNGQVVVKNISFSTEERGVIGFLGPNGAGKSTTMKMITGYLLPDSGDIEVCGLNAPTTSNEVKEKIGYLPEGNPLYYEMYVREYLDFVGSVQRIENLDSRIEEVIKLTGLSPEASKKTGQLSKGYKQRVGLAAAILHDPEVLILDEPTSGLDPNQIIEIRTLIKELGKSKTVLFSSHILQEVESICSRIIIINNGEIVADDRLENLKNLSANESVILVKFGNQVDANWHTKLNGVTAVFEENDTYHFTTNDPGKLRKEILTYALEHDLNILSIDSQSRSLENVFKDLTNKNEIK